MIPFMAPMMMGQSAGTSATTTWSSTDKSADWALSNNGRTATRTVAGTQFSAVRANSYRATGKNYAELKIDAVGSVLVLGLARSAYSTGGGSLPGATANGIHYRLNTGDVAFNNGTQFSGSTLSVGDVLGIGLEFDTRYLDWYKNGVLQGTSYGIPSGELAIVASNNASPGSAVTLNAGQAPFLFPIPSGFSPWG